MTRQLLGGTAVALLLVLATGCADAVPGAATAAAGTSRPAGLPATADDLGDLVLADVPSGLPRVPDEELEPPAGPKTVQDVAGYAEDPEREAEVLADYGYRWGWERFWKDDPALTSVFVDQFAGVSGAAAYAADLARNDTEYYGGSPDRDPDDLPAGCSVLTVDAPAADTGLGGPAAFVWCAHGPFTVAVAAVAADPGAALAEAHAATLAQLELLPRG